MNSGHSVPPAARRVTPHWDPCVREPAVVRVVTGIPGRVSVRMELRLRFDYGHLVPWVRRRADMARGPDASKERVAWNQSGG